MGIRSLIALCSMLSVVALGACSKDATTKVAPETQGQRGENCQARNDCVSGLACLNGICAKNEFNIEVTAKQCTRVECKTDDDCCGGRATVAPKKCAGRDEICTKPTLTGCVQTACTSDATCQGGAPCMGTCTGQGQTGMACSTVGDCTPVTNTCVINPGFTSGTCSATFNFCDAITPCATPTVSCTAKSCRCQNPAYDPTDPICTDTDCEDICLLRCQDSLCLQDKSCKADAECLAVGLKLCDSGRCVQCLADSDCDEKNNETCDDAGRCHKPCTQNEECGLFEACNKKTGACTYVGCQSDRECILAASRGQQVTGTGGSGNTPAVSSSGDDPRLYKCLPSSEGSSINTCKIPCENDGSCGQFQACDAGFCKFVGCKTDEECRVYLGIANQTTSDTKPYVTTAKCEDPPTDAAASQ